MTTRYITQTKLTSLVGSELAYPNDRKVTSEYDSLYRRTTIKETSSGNTIASTQFIGPSRSVETTLANGITRTVLNNARTHSAAQSAHGNNPAVPNPAWGTASSDRLGFDGSGRPITKRYLAGGINETTHAYNNTAPVVGQTTIYDRASNKMYERELHAEPRSALYDPFDIDTGSSGGYDSANRLRQYQRGTLNSTNGYLNQGGGKITAPIALPDTDTQRTYDLDGLGNWKRTDFCRAGLGLPSSGDVVTDLRQHNKLNQITSRDREGAGKAIFVYDSNGNLQDDGTLLYEYDALNRLIEVKRKSDSATIGQYVYDAQNRRIKKVISNGGLSGNLPNGTTTYLYHNWQVIEERDSDDETTKQYIWGEYIDELIQMKTAVASGGSNLPAGDYYPLQDLLYRNTALTDSTGAIVETYDTDAYGNTLIFKSAGTNNNWWADNAIQTDNPVCEIIYCGYRYDPETKLYYVRHRTYNPTLGRWLQRDPIGYQDGMNLYEYVGDGPVRSLDPFGRQIEMLLPPPGTFYPKKYNGKPCGCEKWASAWKVGNYDSLKDCAEASSHPSEKIGLLGDVIGYMAELFEMAGGEELSVVSFVYDIGNYIGGYIGCARQVCSLQKQYHWDGCKWVCGGGSSPHPTAPPPNVPPPPINVPTIGQFFGGLARH